MSTEDKDKNPIDEYLELIERAKNTPVTPARPPRPTQSSRPTTARDPSFSRPALARLVQPSNPQDPNYNQRVSPVEGFLNKIFAGAAGTSNVLNKVINEGAPTSMTGAFGPDRRANMEQARQAYREQGVAAIPEAGFSPEQEYWKAGAAAAWNSDYTNPNLVWGSDVINNYFTSRGKEALNREDASFGERAGLFAGGLAIDILGDPITYVPGGILVSGVRGAIRGAQAAKGAAKVPAAVKGVYSGAQGTAYKVGKFSGRPKPVGLRQWAELRQYDSVARVAARQQIPLDDLFKVASGQIAAEALAKSVNTFTSGTKRATNYTAQDITQIVDDLGQGGGLNAAERMHYGALTSPTGDRYWAQPRTTSQPMPAGTRAYGAAPPKTQQNFNPWASMSDGVAPPPVGVHNTFGKTSLGALNLPPTATYEDAGASLTNIMRNPDVPQAQKDAAFEAYQEIIETLPSNRRIGDVIENIIANIPNPAVATKIAEKVAEVPLETPSQQVGQLKTIIDELADADAAVGFQPQLAGLEAPEMAARSRIFEAFIDSVDSGINDVYTNSERAKYRMLLEPDENLTEILFGTNKAWSGIQEAYMDRVGGIAEAGADSVYNGIKALAELPIEIPGYTQRARELVLRTEAADATERSTIINNLNRTYEESLVKVGALDDMGRPINVGETAWQSIDETGVLPAQALTAEIPETATELGKFVNIFGDIVEDPAFDLTKALQGGTGKAIADLDAGIDPAVASKELRRVLDAGENFATTANREGLKGADSIVGRTPTTASKTLKQAGLKELVAPNVPRVLDDIYDHVVGFARVPLKKDDWVDSLKRVAATDAAVAPRAIKIIKALGLNNPPFDAAKIQEAYANYIKSFEKLRDMKFPNELGGRIDDTAGVDMFGRIFREDYAEFGDPLKKQIFYGKAGAVTYAESGLAKTNVAKTRGTFVKELEARQTARLERGNTIAELGQAAALGERRKLAGDKPGAPFTSRDKWRYSSLEDVANDPIRRRATDGAWITKPETLVKVVTEGDVSASAANLVENLKLSRKLDEGLEQILPGMKYRQTPALTKVLYEKTSVREMSETSGRGTTQVIAQTRAALETQSETISDILRQAAQRFRTTAKAPKNTFKDFTRTLQGQRGVEVFKYDQGRSIPDMTVDGKIVEGSDVDFLRDFPDMALPSENSFAETTEKLAYVNMEPVRGALDNVLDAASIPEDLKANIRPILWNSILDNMSGLKGGEINVNFNKVIDDFVDTPFRTGKSKIAVEIEAEAGLTETVLRNAGETLKKWNEEYGYTAPPAQTLATSAKTYNSALYKSLEASESLDGYIDQVEKIFAELSLNHKNIDPTWLKKTAEVIARGTGDTQFDAQKSSGEALFDYIKSKTPQLKGLLTESKVREIAQFDAINKYTLLNGDVIARMAEGTNPSKLLTETRAVASAQIAKIINKTEAEAVRAASLAGYSASIARLGSQGATKRVPGTRWRTYQQNAVYTAYKAAKSVIDQKFAPGTIENWNATIIASRDLRALLRESGIVETTVMRPFGGKIVPRETGDVDFSYTSWLDVMDASISATPKTGLGTGLPEDVFRVALDLHKVNGLTFPQTVLAESGIMAMKMAGAGMDETTRIAWLYDFIKYQIGKIPAGKAYADDITADVSTPTSKLVAMLARSIGSDDVVKNLNQRHINAGALAVAVAERNSSQISEPILRAVENVANNIYATPGDVNKALTRSVDMLRKELAQRGYGKGSLESLISLKSLERVIAENVSANTISGARVGERMARAAETPATQKQAANAVRSETAKSTYEMADNITVQDLLGKLHQALKPEATETALENVIREIMHMSDYSIKTTQDLMQFVSQQPNTMRKPVVQATPQTPGSPPTVRALGLVADRLEYERQPLGDAYFRLEADGVTGKELDEAFAAFDEVDQRYQAALAAYEAARDAGQTGWGKTRPAIGGAKTETDDRIGDDIMGKGIEDSLDPEMPQNLESFQNQGAAAEVQLRASVRAGQQDIATARTGAQSITDSVINTTEVRLEALARKFKKIPADVIGGLLTRVAKLKTPESKKAFVDSLPPEQQQFMEGFFWSIGHLFDSNTIARTGLDSKWIDKHLFQTQLASVGKARLSPRDRNVVGWDIETAYNKLIVDVLEAGPEGGGTDWLTLFKGLNQAIYDSTLMPNLAGDFSSRFGHEAAGMTADQAKALKWVRIQTGEGAGDLARFLDATQYFPPDMARQMANMQRMFSVKTQPDSTFGRKVLNWFDRVQGSIKSFLTLWALSHHIVASMGEATMNIIAGESNPKNFAHALRVLAAGGDISKNPASWFRHNKTREMDIFKELGFKTSDDDAKDLVKTVIQGGDGRGMKMTPAQIHDFFESIGIKMTNNTVEDYTYRNSQLVRDGNLLRKVVSPIIAANRGLGHFASTRDNVFRFQHAMGILRGTNPRSPKVFRTPDDAKDYIQREIFEWHPTAQSLAPFERAFQRRAFLFYTWQRVALNRIMEATIDDPYRLGIIPKAIQSASAAMGGDPQAPGNPMPNDPRLPAFAQEHILGPAWYDQYGEVQSIAMNSPQLDLFQTFFGGFGIDQTMTAQENIRYNLTEIPKLIVPQLSPVFKLGIEGSTGTAISSGGPGPEITDWGQRISDTLGFSRQSIVTGITPLSERGLFAPRDYNANSFGGLEPAEIEWLRQRTTFNLLTGLKWDQKSRFWRSAQIEQQERYARFQRNLLNQQREEQQ
jgi:hypothetical protein